MHFHKFVQLKQTESLTLLCFSRINYCENKCLPNSDFLEKMKELRLKHVFQSSQNYKGHESY